MLQLTEFKFVKGFNFGPMWLVQRQLKETASKTRKDQITNIWSNMAAANEKKGLLYHSSAVGLEVPGSETPNTEIVAASHGFIKDYCQQWFVQDCMDQANTWLKEFSVPSEAKQVVALAYYPKRPAALQWVAREVEGNCR